MYHPQVVSVGGSLMPWIGTRPRVCNAMPTFVPGIGGSNAAPYVRQIRCCSSSNDSVTEAPSAAEAVPRLRRASHHRGVGKCRSSSFRRGAGELGFPATLVESLPRTRVLETLRVTPHESSA